MVADMVSDILGPVRELRDGILRIMSRPGARAAGAFLGRAGERLTKQ
ncbi:hypothetical protein [Aquabacter spiritensis]|nr:hypothetical protein [Aquabacter spiritensis]